MPVNTEVRTVLVVDDSGDTRRVVRWMLEQRGYVVIEAADGQQAVASQTTQRLRHLGAGGARLRPYP